ncbi:hypothetical protein [Pseudomonas serbica]|uniref:hypothetical protein n=1 Tax=Pseudomonas serbica TaxID=2965074 RepID=UPI00237C35C6|nr:hypothetical protein [Pseudomonas serbica]
MRPTKKPLTPSQKKFAIGLASVSVVILSFVFGGASMHSYEKAYKTPILLENLRTSTEEGLIQRAQKAFHGDELAILSFVSGLRQAGVAEAYNREISTLRNNALKEALDNNDVVALQAIDTRMADELLIEAMSKLGDQDLFGVLEEKSNLFLAENGYRMAMLSDTESTDAKERARNLYWAHTTLSEEQRDALTACYLKLKEKLGKLPDDHLRFDAGSGTCDEPARKKAATLFNPREYLKYQ